ncbi:O-antigen ligase family protein [Lutibacter sp.]|uniref:O-antigen ligase family protein n=1 Tax=Lutibacter sp. TaxID=1925666 RepID=UPI0027331F29|nr:O-antigen ligase family protein [Lutibacter sp.]MDP3312597.1 O-antigen ligase family protein [Lutibacter sp.]
MKVISAAILIVGIVVIIKSKNQHNEAILWSAYVVGAEVFFRMSKGLYFYELPKYSVLLFLIIGLVIEKKNHHISVSYLFYILLLLIGISFVNLPYEESVRTAIAFNLSGPVLLGVSAIYFYKRKIPISTMLSILFFMALPIISMVSLLYFKTPSISDIEFGGVSNRTASGGYGPNQVATILGVGAFIFMVYLVFKRRIFSWMIVDVLIMGYLIFRGLVTFSRGGMITALIAGLAFLFFYFMSQENKIQNFLKFTGLALVFGIIMFISATNATDGMLVNRYTNKNALGVEKQDATAGRLTIIGSEFKSFLENPFFGIGIGGGKFYRMDEINVEVASHNELSRLLGEHGMLGLIALLILISIPIKHILGQPYLARAFLSAFFVFWFLTINHSAMRVAFPAFIYGLSLVIITNDEEEEDSVHRY